MHYGRMILFLVWEALCVYWAGWSGIWIGLVIFGIPLLFIYAGADAAKATVRATVRVAEEERQRINPPASPALRGEEYSAHEPRHYHVDPTMPADIEAVNYRRVF